MSGWPMVSFDTSWSEIERLLVSSNRHFFFFLDSLAACRHQASANKVGIALKLVMAPEFSRKQRLLPHRSESRYFHPINEV